ncbi:MAG TPA: ParB/RepB/Spo0J family partition protein [Thermodesulfobacteriota bacterium]|jgi:ParB family chromosome partitioning protein
MSRKALGRGLSALFNQNAPLDQDLLQIDIDQLEPTPYQPRQVFKDDKLFELAESIKANGILQPIIARRIGERFQIIAGERRWRAAQLAGLHKVPCVIKDIPEENILELSLIENIQREELNPIEEANAYKNLLEILNLTQEEVARRVGKDRSSITNALRLLRLPFEVQRLVEDSKISMGHARALLAIESQEQQKALAEEVITKSLSVRETERLAKRAQRGEEDRKEKAVPNEQAGDANVKAAELRLSQKLAAPVRIRFQREGGFIEIKFNSTDDLSRLFDILIQRSAP